MARELRLSEVLGALSYALDITEGQPLGHSVRTCLIGMRLAEELGLPDEERSALFYALLLKDLGCSSNAAKVTALFGTDDIAAKRALKLVDWSRYWSAGRLRVPCRRTRRLGAERPAGREGRPGRGARADPDPLRPRRRDRATCSSSRTAPPRRSARSTSTGTAAATRRAARRGDPAAGAHPWARADRGGLLLARRALPAALRMAKRAIGPLVRPRPRPHAPPPA